MTHTRRPKSADSSTKPLRSSPLAGPVLNHPLLAFTAPAPVVEPTDQLLMFTTPPLCQLHPKSCHFCDACSASPTTTFRRRNYGPIAAATMHSSGRSQSLYAPPTGRASSTRTVIAMPEWEIDPLQNPIIPPRTPKSRLRPQTSSGIPSSGFRRPIPIVEEEADLDVIESSTSKDTSRNSSTSEFTHSRSTSLTHDNSWYTANPYGVTPRFSRLGLSASNVVMPLSPKEHRRLSSRTRTSSSASYTTTTTTTTTTTKRLSAPSPKPPPISPAPAPTRISLQPHPHPPPPTQRPSLPRTISCTTSSSETSSIASTSQLETPTPISTSTSAPSLTRSRNSEDSLSTSYESWPPTTPPPERGTAFPAEEEEEDGKKHERDKGKVDDEEEMERIEECCGHPGHDHDQIHYSDVTVKNDSDDDGETQPDQELGSDSITIEQPKTLLSRHQLQQPTPQPTLNPSFRTVTFPKDIKKGRDSQRKPLVRIKLQSVDIDDLAAHSSYFSSTMGIKTTTTTTTMAPLTTAEGEAGQQEVVVVVGLPEVQILPAEDMLASAPPLLLPTPTLKKKRSTLKSILKNFIGRWW